MKKNFVKRLLSTIAIMVAICALATVSASACTTIYVGGLLSSRDGYLWELTGWTQGSQAS